MGIVGGFLRDNGSSHSPWIRLDAVATLPVFDEEGACCVGKAIVHEFLVGFVNFSDGGSFHVTELGKKAGLDVDGFKVVLELESAPGVFRDPSKAFWGDDERSDDGGAEDSVVGGEESVLVGGHCSGVWLVE